MKIREHCHNYLKKNETLDCATKINYVVNEGFEIRTGYDVHADNRVMSKLNLKYSDDEKPGKGCVARIIIKRRCNISKLINKRCERTHMRKITKKRNSDEVKENGDKDESQSFKFGSQWYTTNGEEYKPSGKIVAYKKSYYLDIITDLKSQLDRKDDVSNLWFDKFNCNAI